MDTEIQRLKNELSDTQLILGQKEVLFQRLIAEFNKVQEENARLNRAIEQMVAEIAESNGNLSEERPAS